MGAFYGINTLEVSLEASKAKTIALKELFFSGKDDALTVELTNVREILNGTKKMAFGHPSFLLQAFQILGKLEFIPIAECIVALAKYRNCRIIQACNLLIAVENERGWQDNNGNIVPLIPCEFTSDMMEIIMNHDVLQTCATSLGIDSSGYLTGDISSDIEACMHNDFCLHQKLDGINSASDRVTIVEDLDGELYLLTIEREFGPGKNDVAFPGGFVELQENFIQAALRESSEEVEGIQVFEDKELFERTICKLQIVESKWWDPRAKFYPWGMRNGGLLEFIKVK